MEEKSLLHEGGGRASPFMEEEDEKLPLHGGGPLSMEKESLLMEKTSLFLEGGGGARRGDSPP